MTADPRIRVLIHRTPADPHPSATLQSLTEQDLRFAESRGAGGTGAEPFETCIASGANPAQALNRAARDARTGYLAVAPAGARLSPRFLSACLEALETQPSAQAVFTGHTAGDATGLPFALHPMFRSVDLLRRNPVGPAFVVRRAAWEALGGLRPQLRLCLWDFWLRLVLHCADPGCIRHLPDLLANCPAPPRLPPREEARAKALLVAHTPGAFEPDVCRWALALLRGETWAWLVQRLGQGRIPSAREVRDLWAMGREAATLSRPLRHSA